MQVYNPKSVKEIRSNIASIGTIHPVYDNKYTNSQIIQVSTSIHLHTYIHIYIYIYL